MKDNKKLLNFNNKKYKLSDLFIVYAFVFSTSLIVNGILYLLNIDQNPILFQAIKQISIYILFVLSSFITIKYVYNTSFPEFMGIDKRNTLFYFKKGIIIAFLLVLITSIINVIFFLILQTEPEAPYEKFTPEKIKLISLLAIIISPLFEEIFFRGFMQTILSNRLGTSGGIIVTAIIFAFSHSQYSEYTVALVSVTAIGLVLGIAKEKTGSIMPGVVAHTLNNILAALVLL